MIFAARSLSISCVLFGAKLAFAQQAVPPSVASSEPAFPMVNANGMMLAQADAAVERARLQRDATPPTSVGVDANGMALPTGSEPSSDDDSFGTQMILKSEERLRPFVVTGSAVLGYTDNVALTRRGERDDVFGVLEAGFGWSRSFTNELAADIGGRISIFRYDRTPSLDFDNFSFGAGLSWTPPNLRGPNFFARYDFTELLDRGGDQILMEHALTLGVQKTIAFGRGHGILFGLSATAALSDPGVAQRQQVGVFATYHLELARNFDADLLYRPAVHFYTNDHYTAFNQVFSLSLRYHLRTWVELNASFSYGLNRADRAVFDYDAFTSGAALSLSIRF